MFWLKSGDCRKKESDICQSMKKKKIKANWIILIPAISVLMAVIAFIFIYKQLNPPVVPSVEIESSQAKENVPESEELPSYIEETNYRGELSQFPDLYQIPFQKTDAYISNKEFSKDSYDIFKECEDKATQFYEALFNVDYRSIVDDKSAFDSNVMFYCDYMAYHTDSWDKDGEDTRYFYNYIQDITDYFATNMVEMEAKFYTDDSLVYNDYFVFVRGELVFTIYASEDNESGYEAGKEYSVPMEAAMQRSKDNPDIYLISSFGKAEDNTFFLNP